MNAGQIWSFLQKYPGLLKLLNGLPKLTEPTVSALLRFLERAATDPKNADRFIREACEDALRKPADAKVEVVSVKQRLPR